MGRTAIKKPVSADLAGVPAEVAEAIQRRRDIESLQPEWIRHYVYRFDGPTTAAPQIQEARIDGTPEPPEEHEVGLMVKRSGLFRVTTRIRYRDTNGDLQEKSYNTAAFRLGEYYDRLDAPAAAVPAAAAGASGAGGGTLMEKINELGALADIVTRLTGTAPTTPAPDVAALQRSFETFQRDADLRLQRLREEYEERLKRMTKEGRSPAAEESSLPNPEVVGKWAETAGTVGAAVKNVIDMFGEKAAT